MALAALGLASPAAADRAGVTALRAPLSLKTAHVAFTLPGGPWKQIVGALAGTPAFGRYALDTTLASGSVCNMVADVAARASARPPAVNGRTVRLNPLSSISTVLRFTSQGRHGAVRWWAGTTKNFDAAAGGVQRLPAGLATRSGPYLIYSVTVQHAVLPRDERECATLVRAKGAGVARRVARTLHIADGPPLATPPFTS